MPKRNYSQNNSISTLHSQAGYSHFLVLASFLVVLAVVGAYSRSNKTSSNEVLGSADTSPAAITRKGFSVSVVSKNGNWDFYEFLCKSYEECKESVDSGFQLSTISGGATDGYDIFVEPTKEWDAYDYIKYYVRSGLTETTNYYTPEFIEPVSGAQIHKFDDSDINAVITPISPYLSDFYNAVVFSDN